MKANGKTEVPLTSHDVARLAGVSQTTVSRVLRDDPKVRPETRARVLRALAETGYQPNAAARAFRTSRSGAIGVVVARLSYQLFPAMLEMISAELARHGNRMIVWDAEHGGDVDASRALRQGIVDGVLLTAATPDSEFIRDTAAAGGPVVLVNRVVPDYEADQFSSDNLAGSTRVAHYLHLNDRRRIAMIGGASRASTIRDREQGFRLGLQQYGRELPPQFYQSVGSFAQAGHALGAQAAIRLLELGNPPDAIFCVNDVIALGAIDGARGIGARVPEDLWVIGYDDIELASWPAYDLTTVRQPMATMIEEAIAQLRLRIAGSDAPLQRRCFENALVIRGSTGRAPFPASGIDALPATDSR